MVTASRDYTSEAVEAARSVLVELAHLLGEYRDSIVLVGGWVPPLLLGQHGEDHVGSIDVDLALDHVRFQPSGYAQIQGLLEGAGYAPDPRQPFIYHRQVGDVDVEVDLLAGEYEGTGRGHRTQRVQGVCPRKARGCDLAFDAPVEVRVEGRLPGGAKDSATVRVASVVAFLTMKGMALADRLKEKDSYDIYFFVLHYPGGVASLAEEFADYANRGLVKEGLGHIADKFASPDHVGPAQVADFLDVYGPDDRALLLRDAYERVKTLLDEVSKDRSAG